MHEKSSTEPPVSAAVTAESFPLWHYRGTFVRAKDGDTAVIRLDLGFGASLEVPVRIQGFNTPELKGPHPEDAVKAMADLVKHLGNTQLYVHTQKDQQSFERFLAHVYVESHQDGALVDVASIMARWNVPQGQ